MKIKTRALILFCGVGLLIWVLTLVTIQISQNKMLDNWDEKRSDYLADYLIPLINQDFDNDSISLNEEFKELVNSNPSLDHICLIQNKKIIYASYEGMLNLSIDISHSGKELEIDNIPDITHKGLSHKVTNMVYPISNQTYLLIGTNRLIIDDEYHSFIFKINMVFIVTFGLFLIILIIFLITFLPKISLLKKAADQVASDDYDLTWIKNSNNDELSEVIIAFQKMTAELKKSRTEIDEEIKQKTLDLQKKIDELEKFNKFTIDRELRMVELKEEIKELKRLLGEKNVT